ncbi:MAG TPA: tetratricopeptide repeat protein [Gaiellaceae bacterium]
MTWNVQRIDDVMLSGGWMPLRYSLGIEAFGTNAWEGDDDGKYEEALAFAQEVLVDHPANWPILYWAARSAAMLGRHDEALAYLERAIPLEPTVLEYVGRHSVFDPIRDRLPTVPG